MLRKEKEDPDTQRACLEMGRKGRRMEGKEEGNKGEAIPNSPAPQYCRALPDSGHSLGCQLLPQQCLISDECNTACIQAVPLLMLEVLLPGSISSFTSPTHKLTHMHMCLYTSKYILLYKYQKFIQECPWWSSS